MVALNEYTLSVTIPRSVFYDTRAPETVSVAVPGVLLASQQRTLAQVRHGWNPRSQEEPSMKPEEPSMTPHESRLALNELLMMLDGTRGARRSP